MQPPPPAPRAAPAHHSPRRTPRPPAPQAPRACENFLALAASNYYDGVVFHRNIKGFSESRRQPPWQFLARPSHQLLATPPPRARWHTLQQQATLQPVASIAQDAPARTQHTHTQRTHNTRSDPGRRPNRHRQGRQIHLRHAHRQVCRRDCRLAQAPQAWRCEHGQQRAQHKRCGGRDAISCRRLQETASGGAGSFGVQG